MKIFEDAGFRSEIELPPFGMSTPEIFVPGQYRACVIVPVEVFDLIVAALLK
jgi:hypothetical protein